MFCLAVVGQCYIRVCMTVLFLLPTVIGFQKSVVTVSEDDRERRTLDIKVQFYSGSDDLSLGTHDVHFSVRLSSPNNATQGIHTYTRTYIIIFIH